MTTRLKDTLLLIGNGQSSRSELREIFASSYHILEAENMIQGRMLLEQNIGCIVAVIVDPPGDMAEIRTLIEICGQGEKSTMPLLVAVDGKDGGQRETMAFELGAADVVTKPFTPAVVRRRLHVLVEYYLHKWNLEKLVTEQSNAIRNTNQVMLDALSAIIEHRSTETGNHILRIRSFTRLLLEKVAHSCPEYELDDRIIDVIAGAAALHDIGKISIPDAILNKPGRLTPEEYAVMKAHTTVGGEMLQNLAGMGDTEYLRYAYNICLYHHERWDGRGYPRGLKGDAIPICAQVVGIADVFDALTSPRVYKAALPCEQAINMILNGECGVFSPKLLACFKNVRSQFVDLAHRYADGHSPKTDNITLSLPGPAWKPNVADTLQMAQVKYQTLLHYLDDTVLELDMDNRLCHVVYNPNPELQTLVPSPSGKGQLNHLKEDEVHPDDLPVLEELNRMMKEEFFAQNYRRKSFHFRVFSPVERDYVPYELVFMRVNTGNDDQRVVLAIWHRAQAFQASDRSVLRNSPALYGLESCIVRCRGDRERTMDAGTEELYSLTGYTAGEIRDLFGNKLLSMVVPEDHAALQTALEESRRTGGLQDLEFRLLRKNAPPVWVQDRSRVYVDQTGQEYVYHALVDNSRDQASRAQLQAELERNQMVFEQMDSMVFELDMVNDYMISSPKWKDHFGYVPRASNFLAELSHSHFHPDDIEGVRQMVAQLEQGAPSASVEIRLINSAGKYIWCTFGGSGQYDDQGRLTRIVGLLTDIDDWKQTTLSLQQKAEQDPLTKLLNKESTQQMVTQYLETREAGGKDAIMLLDMDNFKAVNDIYGHLYGDAVLAQAGASLRRLFRPSDIIGRIGGDEFLILMKDVADEGILRERCTLLIETFRQQMDEMTPNLNCSWSIGVAMAPEYGGNYQELFKHADEALYTAKSNGKNGYRIYSNQDTLDALHRTGEHTITRIDSDEVPGMADNTIIRFVFRSLYESRDFERTINQILAYIGKQINVSRIYIFENNDDNTACSNTFEWCNEGIAPQIHILQNISYITDLPGWIQTFNERDLYYCSDINTLPENVRAIVEPQGIKSLLLCGIRDKGEFRGYVGIDDCSLNRMWSEDQIVLLEFLSEVLGLFLLKQRSQEKLQRLTGDMEKQRP